MDERPVLNQWLLAVYLAAWLPLYAVLGIVIGTGLTCLVTGF